MQAIVIGAGIGGLASAIGLRRAGVSVEVFERAAELREVGAGISLWANAIRALDRLGVGEAIRPFSVANVDAGLWTSQGERLGVGSVEALGKKFGEFCLVMHRADLLAALLAAFDASRVHVGKPCVGFQQDAGGVVARFADGSSARADILIGADGLHSVVRAQLHGARRPRYSGYTAWRAVVPFDTGRLRAGESWGRGMRFGHLPMSGGQVYWYATRNAPEGERAATDHKTELGQLFGQWHAPIPALIEATGESAILRNDIYDRPVLATWGAGRVTLVGDAAHPMTPNLGQGACQAIEDAVVLARRVGASGDPPAALRAYEADRIPRANALVTRSRQAGALGQWHHPAAVYVRNLLLKSLGPRLQARQLDQILSYDA